MRRNRLAWLSLVLLGGCSPPLQAVRVDVDRIVATEPVPEPPPVIQTPKPPPVRGGQTIVLHGLPAGFLSDPSRAKSSDVEAAIVKQQLAARRSLEARLRNIYHDQVRQFQLNLEREISGTRPKWFDDANVAICARFEKYADDRAPLVIRLYDLVGFPDPNPDNKPVSEESDKFKRRRLTEASVVRKRLAAVEAAYQRDKVAILAKADDQLSAQEAAMFVKVRDMTDRLEQQASREATVQVPISAKDLGLQLTDTKPITLPATKDRVVVIPGDAPLPQAPEVPSSAIPNGVADRRNRIEHELQIWLGVRRYRLAPDGRDETTEFQTWRRKFQAGP